MCLVRSSTSAPATLGTAAWGQAAAWRRGLASGGCTQRQHFARHFIDRIQPTARPSAQRPARRSCACCRSPREPRAPPRLQFALRKWLQCVQAGERPERPGLLQGFLPGARYLQAVALLGRNSHAMQHRCKPAASLAPPPQSRRPAAASAAAFSCRRSFVPSLLVKPQLTAAPVCRTPRPHRHQTAVNSCRELGAPLATRWAAVRVRRCTAAACPPVCTHLGRARDRPCTHQPVFPASRSHERRRPSAAAPG